MVMVKVVRRKKNGLLILTNERKAVWGVYSDVVVM